MAEPTSHASATIAPLREDHLLPSVVTICDSEKKRKVFFSTDNAENTKKSKVAFDQASSVSSNYWDENEHSAVKFTSFDPTVDSDPNQLIECTGESVHLLLEDDTTDSETNSQATSESSVEDLEKEFQEQLYRIRRRVLMQMLLLFLFVVSAVFTSLLHCHMTNCTQKPVNASSVANTSDAIESINASVASTLPVRKGSLQLAMLLLGLEAEYQESYHYPFEEEEADLVVM